MTHHVHVHGRAVLADATDLITRFGAFAEDEAAIRADHSRALGNLVRFCHWRQIERVIPLLRSTRATGCIH